jgi:hypothetical protein
VDAGDFADLGQPGLGQLIKAHPAFFVSSSSGR